MFFVRMWFCLVNWTRADFATLVQINNNKKIVKTLSDPMNPTRIHEEVSPTVLSTSGLTWYIGRSCTTWCDTSTLDGEIVLDRTLRAVMYSTLSLSLHITHDRLRKNLQCRRHGLLLYGPVVSGHFSKLLDKPFVRAKCLCPLINCSTDVARFQFLVACGRTCSRFCKSLYVWSSYVYLLYWLHCCFTLDAGLLARSQYPEGPVTDHLGTGFSCFPCV
jgi:hypothetical protein